VFSLAQTAWRHGPTRAKAIFKARAVLTRFASELTSTQNRLLLPLRDAAFLTIKIKYKDNRLYEYIPSDFGNNISAS
jgi:hypothetical protein